MKKSVLVMIFYCCMQLQQGHAQDFPNIHFSLLNTTNGLPTNLITGVFKDSRGLIWMGTEDDGLLRYDGRKTKSYHYLLHPGGIKSNYVGNICEDKQGWLWISTLDGLYHLNPITEEMEVFRHNNANPKSLSTNEKPSLFVDSKGRLWITGNNGLQQFNPATKSFTNFSIPSISNPAWQLQAKSIGAIIEDAQHRLWAGSAYGIYLIDTLGRTLQPYYTGSYVTVTSIYEDAKQQIWIGFWGGGLKKFNPANGVYKDVFNDNSSTIQCIGEWVDERNKRWLYYYKNNVFTLHDVVTNQSKSYPADATKENSIKGNYTNGIYNDKKGCLWICTDAGICLADQKMQQFTSYLLNTGNNKKNEPNLGEPMALLVTNDKYLLSAWHQHHLYYYNKNWEFEKYIHKIPPSSTSPLSQAINTIQKDEQGNIWYGTDSGLVKQTGDHYQCFIPPDYSPLVEARYAARNILQRSDGLYWSRFVRSGVYIFDADKNKFYKNYRSQFEGNTTSMEYDKKGKLWLGTDKGLYYYQPSTDSFVKLFITSSEEQDKQFYNTILSVYFDKDNNGWIGTYGGLVKLPAATNTAIFITDPVNPKHRPVNRILEDTTGTIWMVSNTGLISYHKKFDNFRYYSSANGLPQLFQGQQGVFDWLNDSTIAVGSHNVITLFNPYQLAGQTDKTAILFTDITIDDKRALLNNEEEKKLVVPAGSSIINIHFAFLNYTAPQQNKLYYQLGNKNDSSWIESADGDITLLNLQPGRYELKIKGEKNGDTINPTTDKIILLIEPYWHQTWLFRLALFLSLLGILYFFIRWRIQSVRKAATLQQQITETEIAALKAQMNPHFIFNCINSIDAFIHNNDKYNATFYLNKFAKLLRNILDSSKQNTVAFSKDIDTLKLYIELEELRHENKFRTNISIDPELFNNDYKVPPLIIQPFVENAILHGLKNRQDNLGLLDITIKKVGEKIQYIIKDNGIGRKAAGQIVQNKESSYGMQMSYDRVKLFNKETTPSVQVNDLYDNGTAAGTEVNIYLNII